MMPLDSCDLSLCHQKNTFSIQIQHPAMLLVRFQFLNLARLVGCEILESGRTVGYPGVLNIAKSINKGPRNQQHHHWHVTPKTALQLVHLLESCNEVQLTHYSIVVSDVLLLKSS